MAISVVNRVAASALRGEVVLVTLDATDQAKLQYLAVGQLCTAVTSLKKGYILSVDTLGNTFQIDPQYPSSTFDNGTAGLLAVGDTINITTP
jgi:hypothetical protein